MISEDKRKAVYCLYQEGKKKKEIARDLRLSRNAVRKILDEKGILPQDRRNDRKVIDPELLKNLFNRCSGYVERVHEILKEEHQIAIGYSTLTRLVREMKLGEPVPQRCDQVPEVPGTEMQHDTSPYKISLRGKIVPVIASGLYYRYSKMRYVKFYRSFNRFTMKAFFHEALTHFGYSASVCVIDNTNLAVWYGTGPDAVFHPEMAAFAKNYGFDWLAHKKGHANRKAGKERNFWTLETNFFPGRSFGNFEDLNRQALDWSTVLFAQRPHSDTRLIPAQVFEEEKPFLHKLPSYVEPPYREHERGTDEYGYVAFNANYYWLPGTSREEVKVIEYPDLIKIFKGRECLITYPLPAEGVRNEKFKPEGVNTRPYQPRHLEKSTTEEEERLRQMGVGDYLDFIKKEVKQKNRLILDLYRLSRKVVRSVFLEAVGRCLTYRVSQIAALERVCIQLMQRDLYEAGDMEVAGSYQEREAYQEGKLSSEADLKDYQALLEKC